MQAPIALVEDSSGESGGEDGGAARGQQTREVRVSLADVHASAQLLHQQQQQQQHQQVNGSGQKPHRPSADKRTFKDIVISPSSGDDSSGGSGDGYTDSSSDGDGSPKFGLATVDIPTLVMDDTMDRHPHRNDINAKDSSSSNVRKQVMQAFVTPTVAPQRDNAIVPSPVPQPVLIGDAPTGVQRRLARNHPFQQQQQQQQQQRQQLLITQEGLNPVPVVTLDPVDTSTDDSSSMLVHTPSAIEGESVPVGVVVAWQPGKDVTPPTQNQVSQQQHVSATVLQSPKDGDDVSQQQQKQQQQQHRGARVSVGTVPVEDYSADSFVMDEEDDGPHNVSVTTTGTVTTTTTTTSNSHSNSNSNSVRASSAVLNDFHLTESTVSEDAQLPYVPIGLPPPPRLPSQGKKTDNTGTLGTRGVCVMTDNHLCVCM